MYSEGLSRVFFGIAADLGQNPSLQSGQKVRESALHGALHPAEELQQHGEHRELAGCFFSEVNGAMSFFAWPRHCGK